MAMSQTPAVAQPQIEQAGQELARQAELSALLARSVPGRTLYLDTETTGLSAVSGDELLELAVVDDAGRALLDTLVRPVRRAAWPESQAIHGIVPADVAGAPTLEQLLPRLLEVIDGADALVIYNAGFDLAFLPDPVRALAAARAVCAMQAYALHAGEWSERRQAWRWHKLAVAAAAAGHSWQGSAHRARADAQAARSVWRWLRDGAGA